MKNNTTDNLVKAAKKVYQTAGNINAKADGTYIKISWDDFATFMQSITDMSESLAAYEQEQSDITDSINKLNKELSNLKSSRASKGFKDIEKYYYEENDKSFKQELNEEQTEGKTKEELAEILMGSENLTASIIILNEFINNQTAPLLKTIVSLEEAVKEKDKLIDELTKKAKKWDDLKQMIAKCYCSYDENGNEYPPEKQGANIMDIGEMAALAFGYL